MTTLETIIAELQRQADAYNGTGLGCFDGTRPDDTLIDGRVDIVALAAALDKAAADVVQRAHKLVAHHDAVEYVLRTFEKDETQGYRSRDRQFAIEILRKVQPRVD